MLIALEERDQTLPMQEIIEQISLLSDAKGAEKNALNAVKLMTGHASKGLEFTTVFVIGCEEGLFPHANAIGLKRLESLEEERRLFYVAITRAKKKLYLTRSLTRKTDGHNTSVAKSRFVDEIPKNLIEEEF